MEGTIIGLTKGDAENLDYSLFVAYCSKAAAGMTLVSIRKNHSLLNSLWKELNFTPL